MPHLRLHLHALILAAVTAGSCADKDDGDSSSDSSADSDSISCAPATVDFNLDTDITEADVDAMLEEPSLDGSTLKRADLTCEHLCDGMYRPGEPWWTTSPDTCTSMFDPTPGDTPETIVGHVQCAGKAIDESSGCVGRRPIGHVELPRTGQGLAETLAWAASLEAASVVAFEELAERLARWGAPAELIERCRLAAAEEAIHAEEVAALARGLGAPAPMPRRRDVSPDLRAVALDNAVEGCVREAWGAVVGGWIARSSSDPAIREVYGRLFADEIRHALLAWDLHTWLMGQIDREARAEIVAAQAAALARLPEAAAVEAERAPAELGMPTPGRAFTAATRFAAALRAA